MEPFTQQNQEEIIDKIVTILYEKKRPYFVFELLDYFEINYSDNDLIYLNARLRQIDLIENIGGGAGYNESFGVSNYGTIYLRSKDYKVWLTEEEDKNKKSELPFIHIDQSIKARDITGSIVGQNQDSDLRFSNNPIKISSEPATKQTEKKKLNIFSKIWAIISDNKLITGIILLIIAAVIKYIFHL